jgi:vacuolar-type H+-ATPase subunit E/Vma4
MGILYNKIYNSCGGVIVAAMSDRIKVDNTIEERVNLVYEQTVPILRNILFPN